MKSNSLKQNEKTEKLFKIVDKVLGQIFGETGTLVIYNYLEEKHSLKREDIPKELDLFTEGLEKYLSNSGASVVIAELFNESSELKWTKAEEQDFLKHFRQHNRTAYT
jgi:hypothetical protein